jgi:hypothetical protein
MTHGRQNMMGENCREETGIDGEECLTTGKNGNFKGRRNNRICGNTDY